MYMYIYFYKKKKKLKKEERKTKTKKWVGKQKKNLVQKSKIVKQTTHLHE